MALLGRASQRSQDIKSLEAKDPEAWPIWIKGNSLQCLCRGLLDVAIN